MFFIQQKYVSNGISKKSKDEDKQSSYIIFFQGKEKEKQKKTSKEKEKTRKTQTLATSQEFYPLQHSLLLFLFFSSTTSIIN